METIGALPPNRGVESDIDTDILIAKLSLDDIEGIGLSRKGKGRADAPLTDEEVALQSQAEDLQALLEALGDHRFAISLDKAVRADGEQLCSLAALDQGETDDHEAALAVSRGEDLPPPTVFQRSLDENVSVNSSQREDTSGSLVYEAGSDNSSTETITVSKLATTSASGTSSSRKECIICGDAIRHTFFFRSYHAPCNHYYCRNCLVNLVETAARDESLYPLRCCRQNFPMEAVNPFLTFELRVRFSEKSAQFSVPPTLRVYCTKPTCSAFLGATSERGVDLVCVRCRTIVCSSCKNEAHPNEECAENQSTLEVKALAADRHWQTCPGCHTIVELSQGCYHMTCRCSAQFCYLCAARWKQCTCPQWDESRLIDDANRRVLNEYGAAEAERQPVVHAGRVRERVHELRYNHECEEHVWRYRHGGGPCEECLIIFPRI